MSAGHGRMESDIRHLSKSSWAQARQSEVQIRRNSRRLGLAEQQVGFVGCQNSAPRPISLCATWGLMPSDGFIDPADTTRWIYVGLTLVHRRRRWTNVKATSIKCLVSGPPAVLPTNSRLLTCLLPPFPHHSPALPVTMTDCWWSLAKSSETVWF